MRWLKPTRLLGCLLLIGLIAGYWNSAVAVSANLSHSYQADGSISAGSLVSLDPNKQGTVELADITNGQRLVGVAVNSNDSLLAVDAGQASTQVATTGLAQGLVSTLNGPIKTGDLVAVSPFSGLGMKAGLNNYVIGLAESDFDANSPGAKTETIKDVNGHSHQIAVGSVQLSIAIGLSSNGDSNQNLNNLQKIAKSITGHTVSTFRLVVSLVIIIVALTALITLVYASIFGSIISIGRNPLARFAIFRTLGSVLAMAGLIAILATAVVFLLVR